MGVFFYLLEFLMFYCTYTLPEPQYIGPQPVTPNYYLNAQSSWLPMVRNRRYEELMYLLLLLLLRRD